MMVGRTEDEGEGVEAKVIESTRDKEEHRCEKGECEWVGARKRRATMFGSHVFVVARHTKFSCTPCIRLKHLVDQATVQSALTESLRLWEKYHQTSLHFLRCYLGPSM